jgi:predicted CopG family antitoxin
MTDVEISDEAYERLEKLKKENESFSDLVIRLTGKDVKSPETKKSLLNYAGTWVGDEEETKRIFDEIAKERKEAKTRDVGL